MKKRRKYFGNELTKFTDDVRPTWNSSVESYKITQDASTVS